MAVSVGEIGLDLVINKKQYDKQLKGVTGMAKKAGLALAAAFSVKKIANLSKQCIELGSDLAEVENVVDVTFPKMSKKVDRFAKRAAVSFGLSETMTKKFTGTFGAMGKAFGFSEKQAYDMSTTLTGLAGDVASFYNITQDEAYTKLKSVFTGETESLKELGVVMTQSALDSYALAKGFGKTTQKMSEMEKVALRYSFVQNQLAAATGDFARTSDGWANQVRVLKLQFDSLKATIGQGLINVLTPVLKAVNTLIGRLSTLANAFKSFTELLTGNKSSGSQMESGLVNAANAAVNLESAAKGAGNATKKTARTMKALMGFDKINKVESPSSSDSENGFGAPVNFGNLAAGETILEKSGKACGKLADKFKKLVSAFNKSGITKKISEVFGIVKENWKTVKDFAIAIRDICKGILADGTATGTAFDLITLQIEVYLERVKLFAELIRDIISIPAAAVSENKSKVEEAVNNTLKPLSENVEAVKTAIEDAFTSINRAYEEHLKPMFEAFKEGASDSFGKLLESYNTYVAPTLQALSEKFKSVCEEHVGPALEKIGNLLGVVGDFLKEVYLERVKPFVDWCIKYIIPVLAPVFETFGKIMWDTFGYISDIIGGIIDTLSGLIKFITGVFTGDWDTAWQGIKDIINDGIVGSLKAGMNSVFGAIESVVNGLVKSLNGAIELINKIPGVKIGKVKSVKLPRLAEGGYVKPNTPQLAMIGDNRHQGEVVAPEDKLVEMAMRAVRAAGGAGGITREEFEKIIDNAVMRLIAALYELGFNLDGEQLAKAERVLRQGLDRRFNTVEIT